MKLVVFGASGNCGSHFVRLATSRGHDVTAIVRAATRYNAPDGANVVRGNVLDADFVARVVPGHDAVMSALGMRYRHPWSRRESPDDFTSTATRHIVAGMQQARVARISLISAAGVGDSRARANVFIRLMISTSNVGYAYADLERVERTLRDSGLDWQAVRPTTLSHRRGTGRVRITNRYRATDSIPREDVATFMLREIEADRFSVRTPVITAA